MNNVASNKLYWVYFWCSIAVCVMHGAGLTNVVGGATSGVDSYTM